LGNSLVVVSRWFFGGFVIGLCCHPRLLKFRVMSLVIKPFVKPFYKRMSDPRS